MARCEVFPNPSGEGYLLDVQAELLEELNTRVVAPLLPLDRAPKPAKRLNPVFDIRGQSFVMVTQFLASVPAGLLKTPVANLKDQTDEVTAAIDMLTHGF